MHEVAMALSVVQIAKQVARENHLTHIHKIVVRKGELCDILEDAFLFAFESLKSDSLQGDYDLKDTKIEIKKVEATAKCKVCHKAFKLNRYKKKCPYCKAEEIDYWAMYDFFVENIEGE